ncbi:FadR/GntR family transcriptional regulator [Halobacillus amylolyticus]|uniref:FadR family transcriptional regulator n=1 Tax=Halobacillus amylolyticus TaxID=2932259 RepID=A0ABY4H6L6_9BACI|nr:FadR/GntR family transcriptional regulator [Halobacillus amylolyticus]UOR10219.1 FadR family transcriptional regulator [Halobacillus amylolyticus]
MSEQTHEDVKSERKYEKIVQQILQLIDDGKLEPGDRLPAERSLSEKLGCSRTSLREAFRVLESEGLIVSRVGGGRFVRGVDQRVKYNFNPIDTLEKSAILHFIEARETLEPKIAELASSRATEENIEKMAGLLTKMEEELKNPDEQIGIDSSFHIALAESTQNFVFVSMMESNLQMIQKVRKQTLGAKGRSKQALFEHRAILEAVKAKESAKAVEAITLHLKHLKERVLSSS